MESRIRRVGTVGCLVIVGLVVAGCGGELGEPDVPTSEDRGPGSTPETSDEVDGAAPIPGADVSEPNASDTAGATEPPTEVEPTLSIVATLAPIADLVAEVGGERIEVASLVPPGMDAHTYEPRPGDVARLADADAYLGIGLGLNEGAVRLARENLPEGAPVVLLGEGLLEGDALVFDHSHEQSGEPHSHDDGTTHTHAPEPEELGPNPHVWTSLRNASALVDGIETSLTDLDPGGAGLYATNADATRAELAALDAAIGAAVDTIPEPNRTLVTYHDAWAYFARDHDLTFATALQPADFSEPSAGELRDLIDLVRELEVPAVFGSEVFPSAVLATLAEETGAAYVGDIADDVLPGPPGSPEHHYLELMRRNARAIVTGLGGDASALDAAAG